MQKKQLYTINFRFINTWHEKKITTRTDQRSSNENFCVSTAVFGYTRQLINAFKPD